MLLAGLTDENARRRCPVSMIDRAQRLRRIGMVFFEIITEIDTHSGAYH